MMGNQARIIDPSQIVGSRTACKELGIDKSTLTRWVKSGRLHALAQLDGERGALVFDMADIEAAKGRAA